MENNIDTKTDKKGLGNENNIKSKTEMNFKNSEKTILKIDLYGIVSYVDNCNSDQNAQQKNNLDMNYNFGYNSDIQQTANSFCSSGLKDDISDQIEKLAPYSKNSQYLKSIIYQYHALIDVLKIRDCLTRSDDIENYLYSSKIIDYINSMNSFNQNGELMDKHVADSNINVFENCSLPLPVATVDRMSKSIALLFL
ncbi:hypothetical protein BB561_001431 [Smittium simulii]|uniref:Uncharacterized protein n=1 Tax=Smittium simulii TaxID=133385 RepID=A0A2T9YUL7_9FUNG|nr:hypothetical protein BB561_001431 [Smittium simulii]